MGWLNKLKSIAKSIAPCRHVSVKKKTAHRELKREKEALLSKLHGKRNMYGWLFEDCDSFLWQALFNAVDKDKMPASFASPEAGKYYRRPGKECYKSKESGSSWSKDMGSGLILLGLMSNNKRMLDEHFAYGQKHKWVMGEGAPSRTVYTPQLSSILDQARFFLGKRKYPQYKKVPYLFTEGLKDYQAHLQVINILSISIINNKIPMEAFKRIEEHYRRSPRNPLYAAAMFRFGGNKYLPLAIHACLNPVFDPSVRCHNQQNAEDTERLFAISLILK